MLAHEITNKQTTLYIKANEGLPDSLFDLGFKISISECNMPASVVLSEKEILQLLDIPNEHIAEPKQIWKTSSNTRPF